MSATAVGCGNDKVRSGVRDCDGGDSAAAWSQVGNLVCVCFVHDIHFNETDLGQAYEAEQVISGTSLIDF